MTSAATTTTLSIMSASQIPDLRTLLGQRGRGGGRDRGGLRRIADSEEDEGAKDRIVQSTDQDASNSRLSAVAVGYLDDPFVRMFTPNPVSRRFPIINRGTYVRTTAIDALVEKFLNSHPDQLTQIISLGAGTDTRFFRMLSKYPSLKIVYHELDFPSNTSSKIAAIQRTSSLISLIQSRLSSPNDKMLISADNTSLYSSIYNIHPIDLRSLAGDSSLSSGDAPSIKNLSPTAPTLLLSECCLIYLSPDHVDSILKKFSMELIPAPTPLGLIVYEPIRPNDAFGRTMVANLAIRGIYLQTLKKYSSLSRQKARMRIAGLTSGQAAADTDFIWANWVSESEKSRVAALEMLDELEEWRLLARHYCVAWGWREGEGNGQGTICQSWSDFTGQDDSDEAS